MELMEVCVVLSRKALLGRDPEGEVGPAWLFCGCRRREEDFLYGQELQGFASEGTLTRLEVAFSRKGPSKVYVQHLLRERVGGSPAACPVICCIVDRRCQLLLSWLDHLSILCVSCGEWVGMVCVVINYLSSPCVISTSYASKTALPLRW